MHVLHLISLLAATVASFGNAGVVPILGDPVVHQPGPGLQARAPMTCPSYSKMVLNNHNTHRANHSAPALVWNQTVANHAASWAKNCIWAHNTSYGEGQNLALGFATARDGIQAWYNTEMLAFANYYGQATPDMNSFGQFGHFSQLVWKGTTSVGCATQLCPKIASFTNAQFTVCNYYPPGNYLGSFNTNVLQPKGMAAQSSVC